MPGLDFSISLFGEETLKYSTSISNEKDRTSDFTKLSKRLNLI